MFHGVTDEFQQGQVPAEGHRMLSLGGEGPQQAGRQHHAVLEVVATDTDQSGRAAPKRGSRHVRGRQQHPGRDEERGSRHALFGWSHRLDGVAWACGGRAA
ncbi:hypothetical protein [Streptomyces sp. NPDC002054]|uniref:hypothetical protein n=1 Tax=Streptomyces sp. NPDC002054 TaxID=3154663 RepID=UPI00332D7E6C